jgi:hypothetical protein
MRGASSTEIVSGLGRGRQVEGTEGGGPAAARHVAQNLSQIRNAIFCYIFKY